MLSEDKIALFKSEVKRFLKKYGVCNWDVRYDTRKLGDGTIACVEHSYPQRLAVVSVDLDADRMTDLSDREISKSALHEVLHLLLTDMRTACLAADGEESEAAISAEHGVIAAITNMEFGDDD